jgi:hypothetical protein
VEFFNLFVSFGEETGEVTKTHLAKEFVNELGTERWRILSLKPVECREEIASYFA